jgi:hypothetical protein
MTENERRAERAYRMLLGQRDYDSDDMEASLTDACTDLRHLCDEYGVEWSDLMARVDMHYMAERVGV